MTQADNDPQLQQVLARIVPALRPEAVYLFGSRARGGVHRDSDYDLLAILSDDAAPEQLSLLHAFRLTDDLEVAVDLIPCRRSVFEHKKRVPGTLSRAAWHEGRLIYGA